MIKKHPNIILKLLIKIFLKKDLENIIWDEILEAENTTVNKSFDNFINTFNEFLSFHAPIQIISIKEKENCHQNPGQETVFSHRLMLKTEYIENVAKLKFKT